jgi:hypothetical protein
MIGIEDDPAWESKRRFHSTQDAVNRGGLWQVWVKLYLGPLPRHGKPQRWCRAVALKRVDALDRADELAKELNRIYGYGGDDD